MMSVPFSDIRPHADGMYTVAVNGADYNISTASVHAGNTMDGHDGPYDHKMLFNRPRRNKSRVSMMGGGNLRMKSKRPKRKVDEQPKLEIFDVSYCLCYLIVLNGSQIIMPHHRIKVRKLN